MSLFTKPQTPDNDPSEERLREWGDGERTLPPTRRGRFANIADRLTRGATSPPPQMPWYRPAFVLGGVSLVAVSVSMALLNQPHPVRTATTYAEQNTTAPSSGNRERAASAMRGDSDAWAGKLTKYSNGLAVRSDPVFINSDNYGATTGYRNSAVVPFVVTIRNDGETMAGEITVNIGDTPGRERTYTYPITLSAGTTFRTTVYPEVTLDGSRHKYDIRLNTPKHRIALDSGYVRTAGDNGYGYYQNGQKSVAILDERIGVLAPNRNTGLGRNNDKPYQTLYAKPLNAPDRAVGYDAVDVLVLGYGCEKLADTQWSAIREWVKDGGSLVLLGGSEEMRRVLATPAALALSPAEQFAAETRTATPRLKVTFFDIDPLQNGYFDYNRDITLLFPSTMSTIARAKADAKILFRSPMQGKTEWATVGARRTLGAGSVAFYGFDPTVRAFRDAPASLTKWWGDIARYDKGAIPSQQMRLQAASAAGWENKVYEGDVARTVSRNPFITKLPDLRIVLYIFLGYFVLVVPVSFVVLKQTRRMQYAWFTGPLLAVTFAGGLALFTRSLYEASQSLRTSGILAMEAGDGVARLHAVTELYAPKASRLSLDLPGTHVSFSGANEYYGANESSAFLPRISDGGSGEQPPVIDVPNLAFRRFYHSQTVTLGKGISATLHPRPKGSHSLEWTITNNTGLTLRGATIVLRDKNTVFHNSATYIPVWVCSGRDLDLPPGDTRVVLARRDFSKQEAIPGQTEIFYRKAASLPPCTPMLTASVSGETFAPKQLGQWVGGDRSVKILVKLPAVSEDLMPKYVRPMSPGAPGGPPPPGFGGPAAAEGGNDR